MTVRLSGFAQGIGYVIAASGPLAVGALYDVTGGWTAPIGLLLILLVPQLIAGWYAARPIQIGAPVTAGSPVSTASIDDLNHRS